MCIKSIVAQKNISSEIIVVDNNSSDDTIEKMKTAYPNVVVISNKNNRGFSPANNQGIAVAKVDVLLLLNPDTELEEDDCLTKMKEYIDSLGEHDVFAPCLLNTDGTYQVSYWDFPGVKDILLEIFYLHKKSYKQTTDSPFPIEAASGAALCFKKQLADKLGGLNENLFWMEDVDFCYRANKVGAKIMYNPAIKVVHHGGKSSVEKYGITIPNQVMSKLKFFKEHSSWLTYIVAVILTLIFIITRILAFTLLALTGSKIWRSKAVAYLKTLKEYFKYVFLGYRGIIR